MAGHSKWKQIKHKKAATDKIKGQLFSKLANIITIAARNGADPQFNLTLRNAIDLARRNQMPQANIERAIKRATLRDNLEALLIEAYGPEGVGILVEAITDNRNRTMNELKSLFRDYDTKLAAPGSLVWAFEKTEKEGYKIKFAPTVSITAREKIIKLVQVLRGRNDVKEVYTATDA